MKSDDSPQENEDMTDISLSWPLNKQGILMLRMICRHIYCRDVCVDFPLLIDVNE